MNVLSKLKVLEFCSLQIPFTCIISFNAWNNATSYVIYSSINEKTGSVRLTCPKSHICKVIEPRFTSCYFDQCFIGFPYTTALIPYTDPHTTYLG